MVGLAHHALMHDAARELRRWNRTEKEDAEYSRMYADGTPEQKKHSGFLNSLLKTVHNY